MLSSRELPRERLIQKGAEALSAAELLAVLLGRGIKGQSIFKLAEELLIRYGSLEGLMEASFEELCEIRGVGKAKALQLMAAFQIGLRAINAPHPTRVAIHHPQQVYDLVKDDLERKKEEHFMVIWQDVKGCAIGRECVAKGTLNNVLVHPREIFHKAVRNKAASIILAHNHPSGDPTPSPQDIRLTEQLIDAGRVLGIPIWDHLIIGWRGFVSLRERGLF